MPSAPSASRRHLDDDRATWRQRRARGGGGLAEHQQLVLRPTFLGVMPVGPGETATLNGLLFEVPSLEVMSRIDARELGAQYDKVEVDLESIQVLVGDALEKGRDRVYTYVMQKGHSARPSERFPIVQSYVDICVEGFLAVQEEYAGVPELTRFAEEFVATTHGWDAPWVNDRAYPFRPWAAVPKAREIDMVLVESLPSFVLDSIHLPKAGPTWSDLGTALGGFLAVALGLVAVLAFLMGWFAHSIRLSYARQMSPKASD
mmetsp:Transcript_1976/g.7072  ORF Transcript_1976/g.7072 Transcript_1976/m.7072 type:complete len:260 (+) Transcript_1976:472-1251(+)